MDIKSVKTFMNDIPQGISETMKNFLVKERIQKRRDFNKAVKTAIEMGKLEERKRILQGAM